jgi:glucokinase
VAVVGIDVGGTEIKAGLLDRAGSVLASEHIATPGESGLLIDAMEEAFRSLAARSGEPVTAVGVGLAAFVEQPSGEVRGSVNTALGAGNPGRVLSQRIGLRVLVDNDANAAGLAEHRLGAAKGTSSAIALTLGTGVGGAVIQDGRLLRGGRGLGAELGHVVVRSDGPPCPGPGCPNAGCIEAFVGARAFALSAIASAEGDPSGAIAAALRSGDTPGSRVIGRLAGEGDPACLDILNRAGRELGAGLSSIANIFVPEVIVVAGGVGALGELLLAPARAEFQRRALPPSLSASIVSAAFGPEAGMIGAGLLALEG